MHLKLKQYVLQLKYNDLRKRFRVDKLSIVYRINIKTYEFLHRF
jgi:hypothetical protein